MRNRRTWGVGLISGLVISASLAACGHSTPAAPAASSGGGGNSSASAAANLQSTDVGITATQIRIAIVADVNTPLAPGLFQASVDAVRGFAKQINASGGIAGRQLVVDFYDSKLNPNDGTNAITEACAKDFAMVGTYSVSLDNFTPVNSCPNKAGQKIGIPDIPYAPISEGEATSPVQYSMEPSPINYTAKTYTAGVGQYLYYAKNLGVTKALVMYSDNSTTAKSSSLAEISGLDKAGVQVVGSFGVEGNETNSAFDALISQAKAKGANAIVSLTPFNSVVQVRAEAAVQGFSPKVWDCVTCYDPNYAALGKAAVSPTYQGLELAPIEATSIKGVSEYNAAISPKVGSAFGEGSYAAGLLFKQAVSQVVASSGNNGLTRASLLKSLASITNFDADGLAGPTNVGARTPTGCFALVELQGTAWKQVYPSTAGQLNCDKTNLVTVPFTG